MKPANKFLIVKPIHEEKMGQLFVPLKNALPYAKGMVTHTSGLVTQVKVGETVSYFKSRIVAEIPIDKVDHVILSEESLLIIE